MLLKDRTKKRLRWFIASVVLVGFLGAGAYVMRDRHLDRRARAGRDAGLKLLEEGDYFGAMHSIGPYVRRHPDDVETLYAYAQARQQVPEPNNRHLSDTLSLLRRVRSLNPGHTAAAETLLQLYSDSGMNAEALQLALDVLKADAKNRTAMKARAVALARGAKLPGTPTPLDASLAYNAQWPDDLEGHLVTFEVLRRENSDTKKVLAHFESLRKKSPQAPLPALLEGYVRLQSGDRDNAAKLLNAVADMNMPNAPALQLLVDCCDGLELYSKSIAALNRHAERSNDPSFVALLAGRLWQLERYKELTDRFDVKVARDAQPAALRALALRELGKRDEALAALGTLKQASRSNASARDWAVVLEPILTGPTSDDGGLIRACEQLVRIRDNPYVLFMLGEAQLRMGDADAAVISWSAAYQRAPAWPAPLVRLAQVAFAAGNMESAGSFANEAVKRTDNDKRSPKNIEATLVLAASRAMKMPLEQTTADEVLALLARVRNDAPDEQAVVPLRVRALAASGRKTEAVAEARAAMAASNEGNANTLIQLASLSAELKLGLEQELLARCEQLQGLSPQIALMRAKSEFDAGRKAQALQLIEKSREAATKDKVEWDLAWVRLLEVAGDPRAKETWIALADSNSENAQLQWAALAVPSTQGEGERDFRRRVLDRLKDRVGDRGLRWRMAHAQWLMTGTEQNTAEALIVLNDLTRQAPRMIGAKLLLADCHRLLGQFAEAIVQLSAAAALQPESSDIAFNLARLLHSQGETARARVQLDRVVKNPSSTPELLRGAAELLDAQGDASAALAALERFYGDRVSEPPADALLAKLYWRTNQAQRAEPIYKRLLDDPKASSETLAQIADFYAGQRRETEVKNALVRLAAATDAQPGVKEVLLGNHAMRAGDRTQAAAYFAAATKAAPSKDVGWRQLIRVQLLNGNDNEALTTARLAQAAVPKDAGFAAFVRQAPRAMALITQWPEMRGIWSDLLDSSGQEKLLTSVADLLPADTKNPLSAASLSKLLAAAESNAQLLPLQVLTARVMLAAGRRDDAARIASRTARALPNNAAAAQFGATTLAAAGRWTEVLEVARQWRAALRNDTLAADQVIATAHSAIGDPASARAALLPHMQRAGEDPDKYRSVIVQYAHVQAALVSPEAVAEVLRPYLTRSSEWRSEWAALAAHVIKAGPADAWLKELAGLTPRDAVQEQMALAASWAILAQRIGDPSRREHARPLVDQISANPLVQKDPALTFRLGALQEQLGDTAGAEASYRMTLRNAPQDRVTMNNLAVLLAKRGANLDEALRLAERASDGATDYRPNFLDTLALVQGSMGKYVEGAATAMRAVELSPTDVEFRIRAAHLKVKAGDIARAKQDLRQIEVLRSKETQLSDDSKAMLQGVIQAVRQQESASSLKQRTLTRKEEAFMTRVDGHRVVA